MRTQIIAAAFAILSFPGLARAQSAPRQIEVSGDLRWLTGLQFNDVNANESASGGATRTLFHTSTSLDAGASAEGRIAARLARSVDFEASIAYGRSHLTTDVSQDVEAANVTASEPVTLYLFEAGISAHLARWQHRAAAPFVTAGGGYLRQLHEGRTLIENNLTGYVGGGLRYALKEDRRTRKTAGLRLELRATILTGGSSLDGATHVLPALIAGVFFHL